MNLNQELLEWQQSVIKPLMKLEDEWLTFHILKELFTLDPTICKQRCRVTKELRSHLSITTLYIDNRLISVLATNAVTLMCEVNNANGFKSSGYLTIDRLDIDQL